MCCSIILVFLALGSPEPLQAQENQKERITIQVKNQPIQKVFDDLSKQTGLKFFYGEAIANRNVQDRKHKQDVLRYPDRSDTFLQNSLLLLHPYV